MAKGRKFVSLIIHWVNGTKTSIAIFTALNSVLPGILCAPVTLKTIRDLASSLGPIRGTILINFSKISFFFYSLDKGGEFRGSLVE